MSNTKIIKNLRLAIDGLLVASTAEMMLGIVFGMSPINYSKGMHLGAISTIALVGVNRLINQF
ncbi:MAG: hypothetical protein ABII22_04290 [Candidatus Micrarchaeota archaeon]